MDPSAIWRRDDTSVDQFLKLIQDPFKSAVCVVRAFPSYNPHPLCLYMSLLSALELTLSVSNQRRLGFVGHFRRFLRPPRLTLFFISTSTYGCLRPEG
jgi:hypothetical protein